jgi:hypothetical protein
MVRIQFPPPASLRTLGPQAADAGWFAPSAADFTVGMAEERFLVPSIPESPAQTQKPGVSS